MRVSNSDFSLPGRIRFRTQCAPYAAGTKNRSTKNGFSTIERKRADMPNLTTSFFGLMYSKK